MTGSKLSVEMGPVGQYINMHFPLCGRLEMKLARQFFASGGRICCVALAFWLLPQLVVAQVLPMAMEGASLSDAMPESASPALPGDAQLEAAGARIGSIEIHVDDVFDLDNPKENGALFRAVNYLHVNTRETTIRPQLLFKSGDLYMRHLLDETARNLRARNYLVDADVEVTAFHAETNTVDLRVWVHDNWTLKPGASFSHSGGENRSGLQLEDANLLGTGKNLSVNYVNDVDRETLKFAYLDQNVLSTRWEMQARYQQATDGGLRGLTLVHPFYSLDTRWSAALDMFDQKRTDRTFLNANVIDQYQTRLNFIEVQGGWSSGLHEQGEQPGWVQRWSLGFTRDQQRFSVDPQLGTSQLPANKNMQYPWLGFSWLEDRFRVTRNRDQIARTEDVYMGGALSLRFGYAAESLGADRNAAILGLNLQNAYQLHERHIIYINAGLNGQHQSQAWRGTIYTGGLRYDWQQDHDHILVVKFNHARILNPDESQQLYLGSDEGLRGYPLRYRIGDQRSILIVEQRAYTDWQILRLLSVGGVAFVDVGHIKSGDSLVSGVRRTFADAGIGLRLGNIRSSGGEVFHFDLAYPFDAETSDRKLQFSVTTHSSF